LTLHSDILSWRRWTLGLSDVPVEWRSYTSLVREALSRADRVAAVSRFLATEVTELYEVHRPVEVIHNGWPVPHVEFGAREPSTLVAGRVWDAAKNITLVAEAAQGWQPGPVYLAGETGHPDGGQATIPPPLRAMGFLDRADLDTLLRRASIYLSAARYDPFGLLPLQAALHGCALLLSDIPSYREVWGDTATFFRSGDAADLRRQWRAVLDRPPDTRAREHARKHLSSERMVSDYRRLYSSVRSAVAA
jgi:glycosyltransferase involved in cell wall biosynthesis